MRITLKILSCLPAGTWTNSALITRPYSPRLPYREAHQPHPPRGRRPQPGVIAMVINTVAQMLIAAGPVGTAAAVVVLVGGHFFNIIINILGAFVHSSRLQYIEFFGKFYEAGGRAFVPLALRTKYTDIVK